MRDEIAVLRASAFPRTGPGDGDEIATAHAVGGDADDDQRRHAPLRNRSIELSVETPTAVPPLARRDLRREGWLKARGRWSPVEQVVAVVELERGAAPRRRAVVAGRQLDQDPLSAFQRGREHLKSLEAV